MSLEQRERARELRMGIAYALNEKFGQEPDHLSLRRIATIAGAEKAEEGLLLAELQVGVEKGYFEKVTRPRDARDEDPLVYWRMTGKGRLLMNGDIADEAYRF